LPQERSLFYDIDGTFTPGGKSVWLGGLAVVINISSHQTGRAFSLVECTLEPGRLVPSHVHRREDESTSVLEGEIGIRIGDRIIQATAGCTVVKPRGIPHTFWNAGAQQARTLDPIAPGGFEIYFLELAELFRTGAFEQVEALGARYGLARFTDWVPELTTRYQLKLLG
jgi:quercetin dioxygenase-like cupin family protein